MIESVRRGRQEKEVLAQDLARQENRADAEASPLNFSRNVVLVSFVLLGLADVSDWCAVNIAARSGGRILGDEELRAYRIWFGNCKRDFIANSDKLRNKAGQEQLGLVGEYTGSKFLVWLDANHALAAQRKRRVGGHSNHTCAVSVELLCGTVKRRFARVVAMIS